MTEVEYSTDLILPQSGQLVDLSSETEVALALREVKDLRGQLTYVERRLREALAERARLMGTKIFHVEGAGRVEIKGGTKVTWDAEKLEDLLRQAGAPEELISEVVVEKIIHEVDARRAARAAKANSEYAQIIEACREEEPVLPTVSIST